MPFPKWVVEPVFLSRKPLPPDKEKYACEFSFTTNTSLVNCLQQLASVAKIADRIFEEIGSECRQVGDRLERLRKKIDSCQDVVSNLNARAVKVPVSDLTETFRRVYTEKPYRAHHDLSTQLFLPCTRPPCIDELYGRACKSPVAIMCTMDRFRTDGLSSSQLFMVTPVLGGDATRRRRKKVLDIEIRKPANFTLAKSKIDSLKCGTSSLPYMVSPSIGYIVKQNGNLELERLPSPEEQAMMMSLEYPSRVVPVDTSGTGFTKMSLLRRSLIHADFVIKRKKSKRKSKRRHTFCEGENRELEQAIRNVTNSSCQTDDMLDVTSVSSSATGYRSLSKRRSRSVMDNSRRKTSLFDESDLEWMKQDSKDSATEEDKETSPSKASTVKKSKTLSTLRSRAFSPISSLSQAISSLAAVKMRTRPTKQDDGRSSSGNWSAGSSTRASMDSANVGLDGISSPSRNSLGKDSVLSDATQQDAHNRSRDDILVVQSLTNSPSKKKKFGAIRLPWSCDPGTSRHSKTPTPDFTSHGSTSTPVIRSPYASRRGVSDDGDSSVYSVDTDGYYTSMHTDSGLWCNAMANLKADDVAAGFRQRQESQSSVSTIGNSSINSFLSKSATECSSNSGSLKRQPCPPPPPRVSSYKPLTVEVNQECPSKLNQDFEDSDKSSSPLLQNGSTSESEHEVRDRIRLKTAITAHRYPSMCAVSPETSDDEIAELRNRTLKSNVNVIVAEVHREEQGNDSKKTDKENITKYNKTDKKIVPNFYSGESNAESSSFPPSINMYRSETPVASNFSASIPKIVATSTPKSGVSISSFSPDLSDTYSVTKTESSESRSNCSEYSDALNNDDIIITQKPSLSFTDKSLIPLKYAQRITVTPIARSDSSSSVTGTIKRTPLKNHSNNAMNVRSDKPNNLPFNKTDVIPSYVSFKAPDSPVSSISSLSNTNSSRIPSSPTSSLPRCIARVTLDPAGKVVYSSNSLDRTTNGNISKSNAVTRTYATLPMCQAHAENTALKPLEVPKIAEKHSNVDLTSNNIQELSKAYPPPSNSSSQFMHPNTANQNLSSFKSGIASRDFNFRPSRGGRFCRSYFPSHLISPPSTQDTPDCQAAAKPTPSSPQNTKIVASGTNYPTHVNRTSSTNYPHQNIQPNNRPSVVHYPQNFQPNHLQGNESSARNYYSPNSQIPAFQQMRYTTSNQPSTLVNYSNKVPNSPGPDITPNKQFSQISNTNIWPGRTNLLPHSYSMPIFNQTSHTSGNFSNSIQNKVQSVTSLRPPDLIPSSESPPSTLDITSPASIQKKFLPRTNSQDESVNKSLSKTINELSPSDDQKKSIKSLSATELFAIIHSSKKKHNIKTESEISMSPLSSRSASPALSQSSLSKLQPVETGVLSKRNDLTPTLDKSKWCNSMPSSMGKKQIFQDKLGTTKPTSMHDFKMLLLQTRSGAHENSPRPSAAELLKVSPPRTSSPSNIIKVQPQSPSYKSSLINCSPAINYSSGHVTVPIKRNMRTRSPYLTRYDSAYPPIMEDCSEELESSYEDSKCLISKPQSNQRQVYTMPEPVSKPIASTPKATSTWV